MSGLEQERETGLVVTEEWPGYISYHETLETVPATVDVTAVAVDQVTDKAREEKNKTRIWPLVWLAIILAIGGEALLTREKKESWES